MSYDKPALPNKRLRVLVVDDDVDTLTMLELLLGSIGWEVVPSHSSSDALERFETLRPDLVLSDIGLPEMDGYELIGAIRKRFGARVPAIAVTGAGLYEDVERTRAAGFDGHITKPISLDALVATVRRLISE